MTSRTAAKIEIETLDEPSPTTDGHSKQECQKPISPRTDQSSLDVMGVLEGNPTMELDGATSEARPRIGRARVRHPGLWQRHHRHHRQHRDREVREGDGG